MIFWQNLFWFSLAAVAYNYAGYALLLAMFRLLKKKKQTTFDPAFSPGVSFIVAAYNEADCIEKKIHNTLALDYPAGATELIFITDGSTDETPAIISRYPQIKLLHQAQRAGKSAALNRAVEVASKDILIFSDANTVLNTAVIRNISRHYQDVSVGGVAGEKKVIAPDEGPDEVGAGEGLYWKYESMLKRLDSSFYSVVGAAGELFSLRRQLYEPVSNTVILDDFIISMRVAQKGYRIVYEPDAYASELPSFSMEDEQKRKVRIAAGGFQAMTLLPGLFRFWKTPRLTFLYISHRVLRWTLSPLCLIFAFVSNLVLAVQSFHPIYKVMFCMQLAFYGMALLASVFSLKQKVFKLFKLAYYFVFMNLSVVQGFLRFIKGNQPAAWEKARRNQPAING